MFTLISKYIALTSAPYLINTLTASVWSVKLLMFNSALEEDYRTIYSGVLPYLSVKLASTPFSSKKLITTPRPITK